ncbi:hypothetical protein [Devosia sp. UYZn731]|uniref:hypothetical protein n=1 Tax=Devosia sp. UYZn731 TaxID=3156345 RepID=UPI00339A4A34
MPIATAVDAIAGTSVAGVIAVDGTVRIAVTLDVAVGAALALPLTGKASDGMPAATAVEGVGISEGTIDCGTIDCGTFGAMAAADAIVVPILPATTGAAMAGAAVATGRLVAG